MAAIVSVLFIIAIWYLATHGKGLVVARLAVWLVASLIFVLVISIVVPGFAGSAMSGFATGLGEAAHSIGQFIKAL
jgi:hypothetical protein